MTTDIGKAITEERGKTHGSFYKNAFITQQLKNIYRSPAAEEGWERMFAEGQEALDMIAAKTSRILSGGWRHKDNWVDIIGYATLVLNKLNDDPPRE